MVSEQKEKASCGKYEIGRTLGEGSSGKVKHARHVDSGRDFAVKILDKKRAIDLKIDKQVSGSFRDIWGWFFIWVFYCRRFGERSER